MHDHRRQGLLGGRLDRGTGDTGIDGAGFSPEVSARLPLWNNFCGPKTCSKPCWPSC